MGKYIIETEEENGFEVADERNYRVKGFPWMILGESDLQKLEKVEEGFLDQVEMTGYFRGARDAIEAAAKVEKMREEEAIKAFGVVSGRVLTEIEPRDILRMLKEYETEIRVGDEVTVPGASGRTRGVVTRVDDRLLTVIFYDGTTTNIGGYKTNKSVRRTGRRFDQVGDLLSQMKNEA